MPKCCRSTQGATPGASTAPWTTGEFLGEELRRVSTSHHAWPGGDQEPVRDERPDLLHTHMVHGDVYGAIAAGVLRVPFVSSRHNDDRYLLGPFRYVDRAFMRRAKRLIAISDSVREFLIRAGLPAAKLQTIHYGLDELPTAPSEVTPEQAGVAPDAALVLAIGRLIEQKDHATLLRAFARVRDHLPHARLAILGWGTLEEETRALVDELGLTDDVVLPGRVEPRAWLERAEVFAHTSRWEGFGIVLLEAMLAGLPVVATRVSAIPEIVVDGQTGFLVEVGDAEAVAAGLTELLDDPALLPKEALGQAGLARARGRGEFSVARMTRRDRLRTSTETRSEPERATTPAAASGTVGNMGAVKDFARHPRGLAQTARADSWLFRQALKLAFQKKAQGDVVEQFHRVYYDGAVFGDTRASTFWLGIRADKCPLDLWIYQELLFEHRPDFVVETGTANGGSALFFASMFDIIGGNGRVVTIDVDEEFNRPENERITYVKGSSVAAETLATVRRNWRSAPAARWCSSTPTTHVTTCSLSCARTSRSCRPGAISWSRTRI